MKKYILLFLFCASLAYSDQTMDGGPDSPGLIDPALQADAELYYEVFAKGFFLGLGFELFGVMIAIVKKVRGGTGME